MAKIKIVKTPPGFAPLNIREQWIDIEIPLTEDPITDDEVIAKIGNDNTGGYQVKGIEAVQALRDAGKTEAANFWRQYSTGNFTFKKDVCVLKM